jgi:hydrogenase maturation factor
VDALSGGAANEPGPGAACTQEVCITCSDEGRVVEVTVVYEDGRAEVLAQGRRETVDVSLVDAGPGDLVLVHAGVAISLVDLPAGLLDLPAGTVAPDLASALTAVARMVEGRGPDGGPDGRVAGREAS